ncbi:MAG: adenine phosphoribosyltransferase [Flammeovirgaceae bacterium]|jgi:adenine phosphoribosyltransferase|nr:adenine phosphoribosyltransferase [Flammeovirgaceae bacterium]
MQMPSSLQNRFNNTVRNVPDFPKPGILFKDITPVLADPQLMSDIVEQLHKELLPLNIDAIVGVESRGFLFGALLAQKMHKPFIPVRKAGKLPFHTLSESYALEYGEATLEIHKDALEKNMRVLIHDDLLATGGTAAAAARLAKRLGAEVAGFSFLINLGFLPGQHNLEKEFGVTPHYLIKY